MTGTTAQTPSDHDGTGLPRPHQGSRWRWSRPRRALATGGVLARPIDQLRLSGGDGHNGEVYLFSAERVETRATHGTGCAFSSALLCRLLHGDDPIDAILEFAGRRGITQIFVGHSRRNDWRTRLFGSQLDRLLRNRRGVDVRVFPH